MSFIFNENACRVIKEFYEQRIGNLDIEKENIESLMESEKDANVKQEYKDYLDDINARTYVYQGKVAEMKNYLNS